LRIFIGLREISGYFARLNQGFHTLGVDSTFVSTRQHVFQYGGSETWPLVKAIQYCVKRYDTTSILKPLWGAAQLILSAILFLSVMWRYDVFIFAFGTSFLLLYDLPILKLLGKKIIFVFHGSDARPPYLTGVFVKEPTSQNLQACAKATRRVKGRVDKIGRYADAVISLPSYGLFHEQPFILHAAIGFPLDQSAPVEATQTVEKSAAARILHSPSNPILKGTPQIERAIHNLRARGYAIDWITITGQPNEVVLRELQQCDFVVDQLYSDWLMPGFSAEAALAGKPSIIAGYDLQAVQAQLPEAIRPPVHACHPDDIEAAIEKLIVDTDYRMKLGQEARAFVQSNWTTVRVAERFLKVITSDIPAEWRYDPSQGRYLHGGGIVEERLLPFLHAYIEREGREALQLSDKPDLEQAFVEFASGK
jgi:hypothetical protein